MRSCKVRHQLFGIVQVVAFGIQIGVADPVIEVLNGFFVAPEEFGSFGIAAAAVVEGRIEIVNRDGLYEVIVFFVIGFDAEDAVFGHLLVVDDIMSRPGEADIGGIEQLAALGFLVENAIGQGDLRFGPGPIGE